MGVLVIAGVVLVSAMSDPLEPFIQTAMHDSLDEERPLWRYLGHEASTNGSPETWFIEYAYKSAQKSSGSFLLA